MQVGKAQQTPLSSNEDPSVLRGVSPIVCTVLWITLGMGMILFNKSVLAPASEGGWNFQFPFFLTMMHQVFATVATQVLHRCTPLLGSVKAGKLDSEALWKKVTPLALFFSLGLVLGNSAYKFLSVSYIQMIKSTLPIPTLLVAYLLGRERHVTCLQILLVLTISGGAVLASLGELHFSIVGFILQCSALFADVFRMLFLDLLTVEVRLDNLSTLYYMAPMSAVMIFIGFMIFEYDHFSATHYTIDSTEVPYPSYFVLVLLGNACLAFALNLSIVLFVSNVGIMAMTLAGIFKDVLVVVLSAVVFGRFSKVSTQQMYGYSLSLVGLVLYKEYKKGKDSVLLNAAKEWRYDTLSALEAGEIGAWHPAALIVRFCSSGESCVGWCSCRTCGSCCNSYKQDSMEAMAVSDDAVDTVNPAATGIAMTRYEHVRVDGDDDD